MAENPLDNYSFEDSDRFEDDSQVSWESNEGLGTQNWRGWSFCSAGGKTIQPAISCMLYQYHYPTSGRFSASSTNTVQRRNDTAKPPNSIKTLSELAARVSAERLSFEELELTYSCILSSRNNDLPSSTLPEKIFLSIIVHCFPKKSEEIRMYSCLANGSAEPFTHGEALYHVGNVKNVVQIGFLLTARVGDAIRDMPKIDKYSVVPSKPQKSHNVSVKVDRCRIVATDCSCDSPYTWCQHVVALCLFRIFQHSSVQYRVTIWDSVNELSHDSLRKFAQYLINELPGEYLPVAQKFLDELKDANSSINLMDGAPDPTDGGHEPVAYWSLDESSIHVNVRKMLCRFCVPSPSVHCDVHYLNTTQHPTSVEWHTFTKPLRNREPEGMWNLMAIVREMMAKRDENAVSLLRVITEECLSNSQVLLWWYLTKLAQSGKWQSAPGKSLGIAQNTAQINCAQLCDEVVALWKCVAINPHADSEYRNQLASCLEHYHRSTVSRIWSIIGGSTTGLPPDGPMEVTALSNHQAVLAMQGIVDEESRPLTAATARFCTDSFPGFCPAIQICHAFNEDHGIVPLQPVAILNLTTEELSDLTTLQLVSPRKKLKKNKKKKRKSRRMVVSRTRWETVAVNTFPPPMGARQGAQFESESTESGQESDLQTPQNCRPPNELHHAGDDVDDALASAFVPLDGLEAKFVKCEAFATYGYMSHAVAISLKLNQCLIDSLNEKSQEISKQIQRDWIPFPASCATPADSIASYASEMHAKCHNFLSVLEKILYMTHVLRAGGCHNELFKFIIDTLKVPKFPLINKFQQIKLYYYEDELVTLLQHQQFAVGPKELCQLRPLANHLIANGDGRLGDVPSVALAQYVSDALHLNYIQEDDEEANSSKTKKEVDEDLALQVSLTVLGATPTFTEICYPMHFEAVRRRKGDLAVMLFSKFKDSHEKLGLILDKLLDPSLHRMYSWHQSNAAYFLERDTNYCKYGQRGQRPKYPYQQSRCDESKDQVAMEQQMESLSFERPAPVAPRPIFRRAERMSDEGRESLRSTSSSESSAEAYRLPMPSTSQEGRRVVKMPLPEIMPVFSFNSLPFTGLTQTNSRTAQNQATNLSNEMPERRAYGGKRQKRRHYHALNANLSSTEANVHHMTELAKRVLSEAGGNQRGEAERMLLYWPSLGETAHKKLQLCAMIIGIYALGLHNRISPSWNTRTYSTSVSWIVGQAHEIGPMALEMIRETWTSHFTPTEVSVMADKASLSRDQAMVEQGARLALSVLPFAHSLAPQETLRALEQCRDHGSTPTEQALAAVETAADNNRNGVCAEVLFRVGRSWAEMSNEPEPPKIVQQPMPYQPYHQCHYYGQYDNQQAVPVYYPSQNSAAQPPQQSLQPPANGPLMYLPVPQDMPNRLHQSHSAPQLGTPMSNLPQTADTPLNPKLLSAHRCGIRALESMQNTPDDRLQNVKFGSTPPFNEEISWLYQISRQLGLSHTLNFFNTVARTILSPFILHRFAIETLQMFPQRPICAPPNMHMQQPAVAQTFLHHVQQQINHQHHPRPSAASNGATKQVQSVCGVLRNLFIQNGFHQITGDLFERASEEYFYAVVHKMSHPRFSNGDMEEMCNLIQSAHEVFKWIPGPVGRHIFDDFIRVLKKQKSFKKEVAVKLNGFLGQLC